MKMVLMTRTRKTSSASLIAREQVAVAVGSPCGVYQYLVCSGQVVWKINYVVVLSIIFEINGNDHIHPLSWCAGNTASGLSIIQWSYKSDPEEEQLRRRRFLVLIQPVGFLGQQLVVLPNHCWPIPRVKLPDRVWIEKKLCGGGQIE